jgi:hypothetical protein
MGFNHSITLPGVSSTAVEKRVVEIVDGDEKKYITLGRTDTLIDFTANNSNISYSYIEYDLNDLPIAAGTTVVDAEVPPAAPEIAPEAPTNVLAPDPPVFVEGDVIVSPVSDV